MNHWLRQYYTAHVGPRTSPLDTSRRPVHQVTRVRLPLLYLNRAREFGSSPQDTQLVHQKFQYSLFRRFARLLAHRRRPTGQRGCRNIGDRSNTFVRRSSNGAALSSCTKLHTARSLSRCMCITRTLFQNNHHRQPSATHAHLLTRGGVWTSARCCGIPVHQRSSLSSFD